MKSFVVVYGSLREMIRGGSYTSYLRELRLPSSEPRREGWFENVKWHGADCSRKSVKFGVQNGVADVGMCPPPKIFVFRDTEGTDR